MDCVRTWAVLAAVGISCCFASILAQAETLPAPPVVANRNILAWEEIEGLLDPTPDVVSHVDEGAPTEVITERYSNRAPKIERQVALDGQRNYVNHGPWKMWDVHGRLIVEGQYRHGQRHGKWTRVLPQLGLLQDSFSGPFTSKAEFEAGQLDGTWSISDAHGRPLASWQFRDGQLQGTMIGWYAQGQKKFEASFTGGVPHGDATYWTVDGGQRKKEHYRHGDQLIPSVKWYDQQQKEAEGWLVRTNIKFDVLVDWWQGMLTITRDESESQDHKNGEWTEWYPNGTQRFAGSFDEGQPTDLHTWWHPNGLKMMTGDYEDGAPEGQWTRWYANGRKQEEGSYLAGAKQGTWTVWTEDGAVADVQHLPSEENAELIPLPLDAQRVTFPRGS